MILFFFPLQISLNCDFSHISDSCRDKLNDSKTISSKLHHGLLIFCDYQENLC
jgi:hypothetical protein